MRNLDVEDVDLVASIYEAGAMPEKWPDALKGIAASCGALGAILMCADRGFARKTTSRGFEGVVQDFAESEWVHSNPRIGKLMDYLPHAGFVTDAMLHSKQDLANLPIYTEFFIPRGMEAGAATAIYGASGDGIILTLEGFASHEKANSVTVYLDRLRPHLARSALLSWQLSLQQAQAAVEALEMIGNPAAMLGLRGQIIAANKLFEAAIGNSVLDFSDRIRAADKRADAHLALSIDRLLQNQSGSSLAIPDINTGLSAAMHLLPISGEALDVFQRSSGLAILAKIESSTLPNADLLEALFDLTPAEAKLARKIAASKTIKQISVEQNISVETVRWHLKNLMQKTGQSRQSDLLQLVKAQAHPKG